MMIPPGEYQIGSANGRLILRTFREGMAAAVGHDLVIEVTRWQGVVAVPADGGMPRMAVQADMRSLEVLEGRGGAKPLSDKDRAEIKANIAETLMTAEYPLSSFESTSIGLNGTQATVEGNFTLAGTSRPLRLTVQANGDRTAVATGTVQQTMWGIKPYKGFMGALKVRDNVDVEVIVPMAG
jgi:polyisoprenoid-binding protein YceI